MNNSKASSVDQLLKTIHSAGYWRVIIRPTRFEATRIPSLEKCWELVETSVVELRGWDYPHLDPREKVNGQDWIQSGCDRGDIIEIWRLYQSAQFVHHFACREDRRIEADKPPHQHIQTPSGRYLSILSSLYTVTEIFEFAARLSAKRVLAPGAQISIKLVGTEGRQLFFWEPGRDLRRAYISQIPEMLFLRSFDESDLLGSAAHHALDATVWIYERFNWRDVPRGLLYSIA